MTLEAVVVRKNIKEGQKVAVSFKPPHRQLVLDHTGVHPFVRLTEGYSG